MRVCEISGLGLLIGESLISHLDAGYQRQQTLSSAGTSLQPYVASVGTNVIGVLSTEDLCFADSSCTAKASAHWSSELTRRFWLYKPSEALEILGKRSDCGAMANARSEIRSARGPAAVGDLLWIQVVGRKSSIEPYCFTDPPAKAPASSSQSKSSSQPGSPLSATPLSSLPPSTKSNTVSGFLEGVLSMPSGLQNLTQLGTADWAHFRVPYYDHKAAVKSIINFYSVIGTKSAGYHADHPFGFSWIDGDPTVKVDDIRTGIFVNGRGKGIRFDIYPDTTRRTLFVYVGVWKSQGKFVAHLSDSSAPDYVDTSLKDDTGTSTGLYKLTFRTGSVNQTLVITFSQIDNGPGLVALQAAALSGPPLK